MKLNEKYTREDLTSSTFKDLLPLARSLKISKPKNMNKEKLINAILQNQDNPSEKVKPSPKISVINDSELSLKSQFNDKILTYSYLPSERSHNSLEDIVNFLYSKIERLTSEIVNYKESIDLKVTFDSEKFEDTMQRYIDSKRYTKFKQPNKSTILDELQHKIDSKDTEGSSWVVMSIDEAYLNITKFTPLKASSYRELLILFKKRKRLF